MMPTLERVIDPATGENLTNGVIRCRTYGHAWDEFTPIGMDPPEYGWRLSLRCTRCTTERHDVIDTIGNLSSRRYIHPDGYGDVVGAAEKFTRVEYRQLLYERFRAKRARSRSRQTEEVAV